MRKTCQWLLIGMFMIMVVSGCGSQEQSQSGEMANIHSTTGKSRTMEGLQPDPAQKDSSSSNVKAALSKKGAAVSQEQRKVIYQADLNMKVVNLSKARKAMEAAAKKRGGYLVNASQSRSGKEVTGTLVFRIPQDSFQSFLNQIEDVAQEISSQNISGNDVTEEYVDLKSRLRAKKAVEKRLLEMMDEAKNTDDLLQVSQQLSVVQEEIEQIKGRIQYLENQTDYSTVTVHAVQYAALNDAEGKPGLWKQITLSFVQSLGWLRDLLEGALVVGAALVPPAMLLAALIIPVYLWYRRRKQSPPNTPGDRENSSM
ncbi:DUF4349 domain-containing protein [Marinithermofilum abyssi]|uniref:DUF4349 domain-containing protein n=1 Tax=Marinithermofilum abyssi TaxID=1571185 RepID=UPI00166DB7C3|nr:DUF4349 domain-containing protein [Marinithermofilum abyssi]